MTLTKRTSAAMALAATLTCVVVSGNSSQPPAATPGGQPTLVGTWNTRIRQRNCQTGEVGSAFIRGLFTFHAGGTSSEYGLGPGQTPALRSPGHGRWQREQGWQEYSQSFTYYRYDAAGVFAGSQKVTASLVLHEGGNTFTGISDVEIFDANDNLVMTVCAASEGTRFE